MFKRIRANRKQKIEARQKINAESYLRKLENSAELLSGVSHSTAMGSGDISETLDQYDVRRLVREELTRQLKS